MQHRINPELLELPACWAEHPAVPCDAKLALIVSRVFAQLFRLKAVCNSLLRSRRHLSNFETVLSHQLKLWTTMRIAWSGIGQAENHATFRSNLHAGDSEATPGNFDGNYKSVS